MKTPLNDVVNEYLKNDRTRFHTPGHQGVLQQPFTDVAKYDLTEIDGLDSLYESSGAIAKTEKAFKEIYDSSACLLSAGGSTLCVQTMLALAVPVGGSAIVSREVHTSAVNTMALLDITPVWAYPEQNLETGILNPVSAAEIERLIKENPEVSAVFITSPTYHGVDSDIEGIAKVCKKYNKTFLVDAAQAAHYKFFEQSKFALDLGADMCCVSLHKTLPSMTGAALLHLSDADLASDAKAKMALFGSTSPSYPIMLSADAIIPYLKVQVYKDMEKIKIQVELLKRSALKAGFTVAQQPCDPTRLTLGFGAMGYQKAEFLEKLHKYKIEPEFMDDYYCVLLGGVNHTPEQWALVAKLIAQIPKKKKRPVPEAGFPKPIAQKSIREAVFSKSRTVGILRARGAVASAMVAPCPPGIPILIPGEVVDQQVLDYLKKYRIMFISVL